MNKLLSDAIDAHGELDRWQQFTTVEADLFSEGELLDARHLHSFQSTGR